MRSIRSFVMVVVLTAGFSACFDAPHFPATPEIEFSSIVFRKGTPPSPGVTPADSLILTLKFKDGDGDLGLSSDDIGPPYNDKYYWIFPDTTFLNFHSKLTDPNYDTLPDFVTPYNCTNWEIDSVYEKGRLIPSYAGEKLTTMDTIYIKLNRNHYNIFINFFVKQNDDSWKPYVWANEFIYPNCQVNGFDGRFPVLSNDLSQSAAQEGTIRYSMRSVAWLLFFSIKTIKIEVYIQDRALHKSNVVSTGPFTLQQ